MRTSFFLIATALLAGGSARADLVLDRIGGASDGSGTAFSSSTNYSISWTAGFTGSFDDVKLRVYNASGTTPIQSLTLKFALSDIAGTSVVGTKTYDGGNNHLSDFQFNLSSLNLNFNSGQSGALYFRLDSSSGGTANWSTANRPTDQYLGWSSPGTSPSSGQYNIHATAVPEPGTLITTGLTAAFVGIGAWLRRKGVKVEMLSSIDQ